MAASERPSTRVDLTEVKLYYEYHNHFLGGMVEIALLKNQCILLRRSYLRCGRGYQHRASKSRPTPNTILGPFVPLHIYFAENA